MAIEVVQETAVDGGRPAMSGAPDFARSSPAARKLAEKLGVDLKKVRGTGPAGRVVEEDVRRLAASAGATAAAVAPASPTLETHVPHPESVVSRPVTAAAGVNDTRIELRGIRKVVAERMTQSFSSAPHFYLTVEVDATALVSLRRQILSSIQKRYQIEPTITDLLIKASAMALREQPSANAAWADGAIRINSNVNVSVAVAVNDGLVVPVIPDADRLTLGQIAQERSTLVEKAREGQLTLPDLEGGSFTLSNLGMFGIDQFQAILNPPQATILAVGRIKDRPVAVDGQLAIRPTMFMTLSVDHRLLDGASAARFLQRFVQLVENPLEMLLVEAVGRSNGQGDR